ILYGASFAQGGQVRVDVYIDRGDGQRNKQLFDWLEKDKEAIERECGTALDWERLDNRRACRIAIYHPGSIESDTDTLQAIRVWSIEQLLKFKKVFGPRLKRYSDTIKGSQVKEGIPTLS